MNKFMKQDRLFKHLVQLRITCRQMGIDDTVVEPFFQRALQWDKKYEFDKLADEIEAIDKIMELHELKMKCMEIQIPDFRIQPFIERASKLIHEYKFKEVDIVIIDILAYIDVYRDKNKKAGYEQCKTDLPGSLHQRENRNRTINDVRTKRINPKNSR